jgi:FkbM family methyltransferase
MKLILKDFITKLILRLLEKFHKSYFVTIALSVFIENLIIFLSKDKHKFHYDKKEKIFFLLEESKKVFFLNKIRGFSLYRRGLNKRGKFIFSSYCLHNILFNKEDIVIDCGANYGDLMLQLQHLIKPENYIAIEPNPLDFSTLKLNLANSKLINKALGNVDAMLPFFISTERGDSSLIEPKIFDKIINIPVIRLDSLIESLNLKKIKLLKIEAEGYEPEVLEGSSKILDKLEYIAVDGGYERGIACEQTLTTITNFLLRNNFEIIDIYIPSCRALFKRK